VRGSPARVCAGACIVSSISPRVARATHPVRAVRHGVWLRLAWSAPATAACGALPALRVARAGRRGDPLRACADYRMAAWEAAGVWCGSTLMRVAREQSPRGSRGVVRALVGAREESLPRETELRHACAHRENSIDFLDDASREIARCRKDHRIAPAEMPVGSGEFPSQDQKVCVRCEKISNPVGELSRDGLNLASRSREKRRIEIAMASERAPKPLNTALKSLTSAVERTAHRNELTLVNANSSSRVRVCERCQRFVSGVTSRHRISREELFELVLEFSITLREFRQQTGDRKHFQN